MIVLCILNESRIQADVTAGIQQVNLCLNYMLVLVDVKEVGAIMVAPPCG